MRRYNSDPAFALKQRMRSALYKALGRGKLGRRTEELLGYTLAQLAEHLERQFKPGMTWENRGRWHIDHIRPLASFEITGPDDVAFKEAWALTNLRPIWAKDNLSKRHRRTHLL